MSNALLRACALIAITTAIGCSDSETNNARTNHPTPPTDLGMDMPVTPTDMGMDEAPDTDSGPDLPEETQAPKCTDTPKPARCDADPATFNMWQPASVISKLVLAGEECCFDYDGNGVADNSLGTLLEDLGPTLGVDVNATIAESIADGTIAIVLEHDGLTSTNAGTTFAMNFLLAEPSDPANPAPNVAGGNKYLINPASFDAGTWPQARAEGSKIEAGNKVIAGPGRIVLRLDLLGIQLDLVISKARIEGELDLANSNLTDKGVAIQEGAKLGGIIRIADLFDAVNTFSSEKCSCLGYTGMAPRPDLISYDPADPAVGMCVEGFAKGTCDENDQVEGICITLIEDACNYLTAISAAADVRADGRACLEGDNPPPCDAVSIGANIGAYGAVIEGVAPAN
jgi:hypothetical protein